MSCPVCDEPLIVYELDGVEIDMCAGCHGIWLDRGELALIANLAAARGDEADAAATSQRELTLEIELFTRTDVTRTSRRCVRCRRKMERVRARGAAGTTIELERCPRGDGLWLDRDELRVALGGHHEGAAGEVARFVADMLRDELA